MNKYNKGTSILEILVSVVIISIVMIFMANLLIKIKAQDKDSQVKSNYLINQALFIKTVNDDVLDVGIEKIIKCNDTAEIQAVLAQDNNKSVDIGEKGTCVRFTFSNGDAGFLFFYKDIVDYSSGSNKNDMKNLLRYTRGVRNGNEFNDVVSLTKEYPDGAHLGNIVIKEKTIDTVGTAFNLYFPVMDDEDNVYNIDVSYVNR